MRGRFAAYMLGISLLGLAGLMLLFASYALILRESVLGFAISSLLSGMAGLTLTRFGDKQTEPGRREALMAVLLLWLLIPLFGSIPFWLDGQLTPLNALFESMSGFTASGATILKDFESLPRSLFMLRAVAQWLGGIGIIVLFIAVFPQLAIAGRQLFFAEAPGPTEERLSPRLRNTAEAILVVYIGLSAACFVAYLIAGMSIFDALTHAFTTVAAGGFSPNADSFETAGTGAQWVCIVFMFFAGLNFSLQYRALVLGRFRDLWRDAELRAYVLIIVIATALLVFALGPVYRATDSLRHALFQSLSILTTSGFASVDYALWSDPARLVLITLMFIGGCAGSAAGGVKIVRWLLIVRYAGVGLRKTLHPRLVQGVRLNQQVASDEIIQAVLVFIFLYLTLFVISIFVLIFLGADFIVAFTASIACIGNVGPGLAAVGPMGSFADLHFVSKAVLIFDMYAGRLEIITVFVVLNRSWWQLPRDRR